MIVFSLNIFFSNDTGVSNKAIQVVGFHAIQLLTLHYVTGLTFSMCTREDKCSGVVWVRDGCGPQGDASRMTQLFDE